MKRLRPFSSALVASAVLAWTLPVYATGDCNNGKSIYFKKAGGVYVNCAQSSCHGAGVNNNNITNGANNPSLINSQIDNEPQMTYLRGTLTDLLIGDLFHDGVDKVWGPLESLYEPDKKPIPTWDAGTRADQADDKSTMLVIPEGHTRRV